MLTICYLALAVSFLLVVLFAASEAVLAASNRVRLRHLLRAQPAHEDQSAAQQLSSDLSRDAQQFIATVTIAANVPLLVAAALTLWLARRSHADSTVVAIVSALVVTATIVLLQITPRFLVSQPGALRHLWWVRPARSFMALLWPPVALLLLVGRLLLRPLGFSGSVAKTMAARDEAESGLETAHEIRDLVESAEASGVLEGDGKELIESIFTFGDTRVHEVMIPRPEIVALPAFSASEKVLDTLQESGLSRIPLYEENVDHVTGILHAKDVLKCLDRGETTFECANLKREPLFLPESLKIDEALARMRAQRMHLAIVIDEYGGTAGLLTIEDILEELVGEIADEHDRPADEPLLILDEHTAIVDALLHIDDLERRWKLALPAGEFDTVGGFMIEQLGRAPIVGDRVELPDAVLTVHAMRGRRPRRIMIKLPPDAETEESA